MGTAAQMFRVESSGSLLVPRETETTAKPFIAAQPMIETTGGLYTAPSSPVVSAEEEEWASLLDSERKSLAKRRVKPGVVAKAIKESRYRR